MCEAQAHANELQEEKWREKNDSFDGVQRKFIVYG